MTNSDTRSHSTLRNSARSNMAGTRTRNTHKSQPDKESYKPSRQEQSSLPAGRKLAPEQVGGRTCNQAAAVPTQPRSECWLPPLSCADPTFGLQYGQTPLAASNIRYPMERDYR